MSPSSLFLGPLDSSLLVPALRSGHKIDTLHCESERQNGHSEVVSTLLAKQGVDVNRPRIMVARRKRFVTKSYESSVIDLITIGCLRVVTRL